MSMFDTLFKVLVLLERDFTLKDECIEICKVGDNETMAPPMLLVMRPASARPLKTTFCISNWVTISDGFIICN